MSPVVSPMMISTSIIFSTGEKKWMPMKSVGPLRGLGEAAIGSVEVFEAKIASGRIDRLGLGDRLGLHLADPRTPPRRRGRTSFEIGIVRARRDAGEERVAIGGLGAALHDLVGHELVRVGLALLGRLHGRVDEHDLHAGVAPSRRRCRRP